MSHVSELIEFLDCHWWQNIAKSTRQQPLAPTPEASLSKLVELRRDYLDFLRGLSEDQLRALTADALQEQDRSRPFHAPGTEADYHHYGRCAFLTASEAVSLSLGKDPRIVTVDLVLPYVGPSVFANNFASRLDLLERSILWGELERNFSPLDFLTWAHHYKLPVPAAFISCTFTRGEPIQYWHEACEQLEAEKNALAAELKNEREKTAMLEAELEMRDQYTFAEWESKQAEFAALDAEHNRASAELLEELQALRTQAADLADQLRRIQEDESKDLKAVERKSLLKMVIAMAVDGYGYDTKALRSPVPQEIADCAKRVGLHITDETALRYLKQAKSLNGFSPPDMSGQKPKSVKRSPKSV